MNESDRKPFAVIMARVAEVFQMQLSTGMVEEYYKALGFLTIREVEHAVNKCIQECKFMPRPADIIDRIYADENQDMYQPFRRALVEPMSDEVVKENLAKLKDLVKTLTDAEEQRREQSSAFGEKDWREGKVSNIPGLDAEIAKTIEAASKKKRRHGQG